MKSCMLMNSMKLSGIIYSTVHFAKSISKGRASESHLCLIMKQNLVMTEYSN